MREFAWLAVIGYGKLNLVNQVISQPYIMIDKPYLLCVAHRITCVVCCDGRIIPMVNIIVNTVG